MPHCLNKLLSVVLLSLALPCQALAIVNVLPAPGSEATGLSGSATLKGNIKTGNTDLIDVGLSTTTVYGSDNFQTSLKAAINYGEKSDETYLYNSFEHLRIRYKLTNFITPEAFVQHQFNQFTSIKFRGLVGLGAAFSLWSQDASHLVFGSTLMMEQEVASGESIKFDADKIVSRWSNYLQIDFKTDTNVTFSSTIFVQPQITNVKDIRILNETGFSVKERKNVSLGSSFKLAYDSRPISESVEKLDTATTIRLTLSY